jgi:hypothetical protein
LTYIAFLWYIWVLVGDDTEKKVKKDENNA